MYVAVHVVEAPGANVVVGHEMTGGVPVPEKDVSATARACRVWLPVFLTSKL
jgi:hypothetical protein